MRISDWSSDVCSSDLRQGGGSVGPSTSTDTSSQGAAPPTAPATTGAVPEPASSPHATDSSKGDAQSASSLLGSMTKPQVRVIAKSGNRQACRDTVKKMRRRSEEQTSELQYLMRKAYADVCMKKK